MFLGKYEVLGQIGSGGFGRVLLARNPDATDAASRLVAIKRLRRAKAQHERIKAALEYEARIGRYLTHPNIVRVIEYAEVGRDSILVMEFVNGIGLDELLYQRRRANRPFEVAAALKIAIQAGKGLASAHEACAEDGTHLRIVHRDVKPSNIMLCKRGRVRIMDFGVALGAFRKIHTTTGTIKGTLRYLSPEQAAGRRDIGPAADQFALGLVLGEMLLGEPVYDARHEHRILLRAMRGEVGGAVRRADGVLPGIGAVLGRALAFQAGDRFPSMHDFVNELEHIAARVDPADPDLAAIVHEGLEERARLALEDEALWGSGSMTSTEAKADGQEQEGEDVPVSDFVDAWDQGMESQGEDVEGGGETGGWRIVAADGSVEDWPSNASDEAWSVLLSSESKVVQCLDEDELEEDDFEAIGAIEWTDEQDLGGPDTDRPAPGRRPPDPGSDER